MLIAYQDHRRVAGRVCSIGAERLEQPVDIGLAASYKSPAGPGAEFLGKALEPRGHIGGWIYCYRYQLNARAATELLLHAAHRRSQWRADGRAGGENEIDRDGPILDEIRVEAEFLAVLIVDSYVGDIEGSLCNVGASRFRRG